MPRPLWSGLLALITLLGFAAGALAHIELRITAPSAPGSGWDQIGQLMRQALLATGFADEVQVVNAPGAGGTVGLADFVANARGDDGQLLVSGYAMVGAILINKAPVSLDQVTPIARLTGEYLAFVVPPDSPFRTVDDLVAAARADPGRVTWAGGPVGSIDHIGVALFAMTVNADPGRISYVPFLSGAEALGALVEGKVAVAVAGTAEAKAALDAGKLRALAVTGPKRLEGVDAPTLTEAGYALEFGNWRGVVAPPDLAPQQRRALTGMVDAMRLSPLWAETLRQKGWEDAFLAGEAFDAFLREEQTRLAGALKVLGLLK